MGPENQSNLHSFIQEAVAYKEAIAKHAPADEPDESPAAATPVHEVPSPDPDQEGLGLHGAIREAWSKRVATNDRQAAAPRDTRKGLHWANQIPVATLTASYRQEAVEASRRLRNMLIAIVVAVVLLIVGLMLTTESPTPPPAATETVVNPAGADAFPPKHGHGR